TKLFITGIPLFGTLIALSRNGKPVIGVVDQPINRERWTGGMDGAASFNGAPIKTNGRDSLAGANLFTTSLYEYDADQAKAFERLSAATMLTRQGTDCYAMAMLAMGFVDIVTETNLNEWDMAAHIPIIENAGGIVTDWQGEPLRFDGQIKIETAIAAANPALHAQAIEVLRG
ncbi:MAG: histidinol phosphate phosphatase, partial [Rhodospirillaceae bacterium]|nr:histidinol phosphate phosphatase [Rhodospirillaceae bacterium]